MTLQIAKVTFPIWVSVNQCTPHFHLDIQRDLKHNIWKQVPHHLLQTRSFIIFFILLMVLKTPILLDLLIDIL